MSEIPEKPKIEQNYTSLFGVLAGTTKLNLKCWEILN
jgi:hypothetical protein